MSERHALVTVRLDLVPAEPSHADETWPHLNDEQMWTFFPAMRPPSIAALRGRYERFSHTVPYLDATERWENWICKRRQDGAAVGEAQATYAGTTTVYVAYGIFPAFQRQGFAREATAAVLGHARDLHGARTAIAEMAAANIASIRVVEALGFTRIKTRRDTDHGLGYYGETYVYRLLLETPRV